MIFGLDAMTYLISAVILGCLRIGKQESNSSMEDDREQEKTSFTSFLLEGITILWKNERLRVIVILALINNVLATPYMAMEAPIVNGLLGDGSMLLSYMSIAATLGMLLASGGYERISKMIGSRGVIFAGIASYAIEYIGLIVASNVKVIIVSRMGKKQTIVKNINAMQSFGSMDILCVDKTGTLTGDQVILEYYMDILGNESQKTLDYAYLASHYHTGVGNHLDTAIRSVQNMPGRENYYKMLVAAHSKMDERPFDYSRRFSSVMVRDGKECLQIIKGSIDEVVSRCHYAESICRRLGISVDHVITGSELERLSENDIPIVVERNTVFTGLSPKQKESIVEVLQTNGHTVGFLGDGMNDLPAILQADVGISVENAAESVKESANVILLKKDLNVLEEGILEGRKAFTNMTKYIKITASSNFGNICAIVIASVLLPFFPMTSVQLLLLNLLYDLLCLILPWDQVDQEMLERPLEWSGKKLGGFMMVFGIYVDAGSDPAAASYREASFCTKQTRKTGHCCYYTGDLIVFHSACNVVWKNAWIMQYAV